MGKRKAYVASLVIPAFCFIGYGMIHDYIALCIISFINGLSWAIYGPANRSLLSDYAPDDKLERIFGYNYWLFTVSGALGPLIGVSLEAGKTALPLYIFAAALLLLAPCLFLFFWKHKLFHNSYNTGEATEKQQWSIIIKDRTLLWLFLANFFLFATESQLDANVSQFLSKTMGESGLTLFASLLTLNTLTVVVFQPIVIHMIEKITDFKSFLIGGIFFSAGSLLFIFADLYILWFVFMLIYTIGELFINPKMSAISARIPKEGLKTILPYWQLVEVLDSS
ncbi:MFS transporter [Virgibacillus sp. FSP13]